MSIIDYNWDFTKDEFSLDLDYFNEKEQEDKLWQAKTGLNLETLCGAIETIVFMSDRPINILKIKTQIDTDIPLRVIHESISRLQEEYEAKHHGIRLMEVAQGYQFRTKATYANLVQKMFKVQSLQLSPTAIEVMAIIAYKQPISKTEVESIRGVDSSHVIRALMDKRLVRITGRSNEMGRPSVYGTTAEFLEVFNLNEVSDLPSEIELEELANENEIGEIADIRNIVKNTDKEKFVFDEIDELDELSSSIRLISSETFFTKSLKDLEKQRVNDQGIEKKSAFDILEEHVSLTQVIEQNKVSSDSETITSVMEPKSVATSLLSELLNLPKNEEIMNEEDEVLSFDENLGASEIADIDSKVDEILSKSENLLESEIPDLPESNDESLEQEKLSLEAELDNAFDEMFGEDDESVAEISLDENSDSSTDTVEFDLPQINEALTDDEDLRD